MIVRTSIYWIFLDTGTVISPLHVLSNLIRPSILREATGMNLILWMGKLRHRGMEGGRGWTPNPWFRVHALPHCVVLPCWLHTQPCMQSALLYFSLHFLPLILVSTIFLHNLSSFLLLSGPQFPHLWIERIGLFSWPPWFLAPYQFVIILNVYLFSSVFQGVTP